MAPARKNLSKRLQHQVRDQCGQACASPKCRELNSATHEMHHIDGDCSNSVLTNLILLCGNCHNKVGAGIFSEADIRFWKRMAEAGGLPPPKGSSVGILNIQENRGIAGSTINIQKVIVPKSGETSSQLPGTIGANTDMRTYATYLVGRYIDWRKKGQKIDGRAFSPGSAHNILASEFGAPSALQIPQSRFFDWVHRTQERIDGTAWGRNNKVRNYHSWEEHLRKRHGDGGP